MSAYDLCIKVALAKDKFKKILTTKCDSKGDLPFEPEEVSWAVGLCKKYMAGEEVSVWVKEICESLGMKPLDKKA